MRIEKGNAGLYRRLFGGYTTGFNDSCAERAEKGGRILIAYEESSAAGYLLISADKGTEFMSYVFTLPEFRGRGVMQALISEAFSDSYEHAPELIHIFEKLGFEQKGTKYIFHCSGDDLWEHWDAYMEKSGKRLCDTLRRQGYSTVALSGAPE